MKDGKAIEVSMSLTRETKGAVLYNNTEEGPEQAVTNLYLRKSGLQTPYPEVITLIIQAER